jgi:hypothetical protein
VGHRPIPGDALPGWTEARLLLSDGHGKMRIVLVLFDAEVTGLRALAVAMRARVTTARPAPELPRATSAG